MAQNNIKGVQKRDNNTGFKEKLTNEAIVRAYKEVQLINLDGKSQNISSRAALEYAYDNSLDLVCVADGGNGKLPVCKIFDYAKFKFDSIKKIKEDKKTHTVLEIKEIKSNVSIDIGDFNVKVKQMRKFIEKGNKVQIIVTLKGRQSEELANATLSRYIEAISDIAKVEVVKAMEKDRRRPAKKAMAIPLSLISK